VLHPLIYGLDLTTNAASTTVDSTVHRITSVALSTSAGEEIYNGDEGEILHLVDHRVAVLPPGVLVTWQGSVFDFPLIVRRARRRGLETGIRLRADHRPAPLGALDNLDHAWCSDWYSHRHLELRRVYDAEARWWNPVQSRAGAEPTTAPSDSSVRHRPTRDARLARVLAERRWATAQQFIDRMPPAANWTPPFEVDASRLTASRD